MPVLSCGKVCTVMIIAFSGIIKIIQNFNSEKGTFLKEGRLTILLLFLYDDWGLGYEL